MFYHGYKKKHLWGICKSGARLINWGLPSTTFRRPKSGAGFIALMSAVIISIMLMTMVLTVSTSSFYARFDALGVESKRASLGLAESCMNIALLRLSEDVTYRPASGGDNVVIGDEHCVIVSIVPLSSAYPKPFQITTMGRHLEAFSNILVDMTMQNPNAMPLIVPPPPFIAIDSWKEIPMVP